MKYRTINDLSREAQIFSERSGSPRELRRMKLEHLASLIETQTGPIQLLSQIEYLPAARRQVERADDSLLAIAYADPVFRAQGLASDRFGDVMRFFDLSLPEAHELFCDCHYPRPMQSGMVAQRARWLARKMRLRDLCFAVGAAVKSFWRG